MIFRSAKNEPLQKATGPETILHVFFFIKIEVQLLLI